MSSASEAALPSAYCRSPNSQVNSGQHPVPMSGATLRSPCQRPRSSQLSVGQDIGADGLVDVLRAHVQFLGDVLLCFQPGLVHRLLQLALPDDPTMTRAACPASMRSPNSLTSARDMPRHRWPLTLSTAAPTAAEAMIAGGNKMPTRAPTAAPPHAPCRVAISSLLTRTLPASSLVTTDAS